MNKYLKKYNKYSREIIDKSFPELKDKPLKIVEIPQISKYWNSGAFKGINNYYIVISKICRPRKTSALKGQLAHELGHLILDYYEKPFFPAMWQLIRKLLSTIFNTKFNRLIELKVDQEAIKRGYGKERLAFAKEVESTYSEKLLNKHYFSRGYLGSDEIKTYLKNV